MQTKVSVYPVEQHMGVLFHVRSCLAFFWLVWRAFSLDLLRVAAVQSARRRQGVSLPS